MLPANVSLLIQPAAAAAARAAEAGEHLSKQFDIHQMAWRESRASECATQPPREDEPLATWPLCCRLSDVHAPSSCQPVRLVYTLARCTLDSSGRETGRASPASSEHPQPTSTGALASAISSSWLVQLAGAREHPALRTDLSCLTHSGGQTSRTSLSANHTDKPKIASQRAEASKQADDEEHRQPTSQVKESWKELRPRGMNSWRPFEGRLGWLELGRSLVRVRFIHN